MLIVGLFKIRPDAPPMADGVGRRAQYQMPEGTQPVAEYWLQTNDPAVITVFEADNAASIMAMRAVWGDTFDMTFVPAFTLQEGLPAAAQLAPQ